MGNYSIEDMEKYPEFINTKFEWMDHWKCEIINTGRELIDMINEPIENTAPMMANTIISQKVHKIFKDWIDSKSPEELGIFLKSAK